MAEAMSVTARIARRESWRESEERLGQACQQLRKFEVVYLAWQSLTEVADGFRVEVWTLRARRCLAMNDHAAWKLGEVRE